MATFKSKAHAALELIEAPQNRGAGIPREALLRIADILALAPGSAWKNAACNYQGFVLLLTAVEAVLRCNSLWFAAGQISAIRDEFLITRRKLRVGPEPEESPIPQPMTMNRKAAGRSARGRRIPGKGLMPPTASA